AVSLNGLAAGTAVTGTVTVTSRDVASIPVDARFLRDDPLRLHDVVLAVDLDRDGIKEVVAAAGLQSYEQPTVGVQDLAPPKTIQFATLPNPFQDLVGLEL